MKAGLFGAAAASLVLSGCYYYPAPYTYYPTVPAQAAGVETIPPNSPDYPQPGAAQTTPSAPGTPQDPSQAQAQPQPQAQTPNAPPPGYNGGAAYYGYPAYAYPAYAYPAYGYPAYPVYGAPAVGIGFSFGGRWR